ncbi:MAG TPA: PucR family transcriptional regulator ligand-binding domain-containing protein [Clostridiales bacterium]|nr:PucR family transcriptional regulator ligand-binding domain-containing protein [Clostridiales bacterium]
MAIINIITISDVLHLNAFSEATLLAGEKGISNEISWVHPMEIWDNPNNWIDGGELIFCSALGVNNPDTITSYFKKLLSRGIAGLALQIHTHIQNVPQEMIDLANQHNCPLIIFKKQVRFIDLSRELINALVANVNHDYYKEKQKIEENSWMLQWLDNNLTNEEITKNLKKTLPNLTNYKMFTVLIEYSTCKISYRWTEGVYISIVKYLRNLFESNQFLLFPLFANNQLTGIVLDYGKENTWKQRFHNIITETNHNFMISEGKPRLIITAGSRWSKAEKIPVSYQNAKDTMEICQQFHINRFIYEDLNLFCLLSLIDNDNNLKCLKQFVQEKVNPLIEHDGKHKSDLLNTLIKYEAHYGNKQLTATELNITRRTLYNRLEQIKTILQTDFEDPEKRITLELAIMLYQNGIK